MGYASQLQLFKVEIDGKPSYFNSKRNAKKARDGATRICIVMRGPDHWRGESYGRSLTQTASSKREW